MPHSLLPNTTTPRIKGATLNTVTAAGLRRRRARAGRRPQRRCRRASRRPDRRCRQGHPRRRAGLAHGLAENVAAQVLAIAGNYSHILFPATAGGKNVAPRVAAKLDVAQISDITKVVSRRHLRAPDLRRQRHRHRAKRDASRSSPCAPPAFDAAAATGGSAAVETVAGAADSGKSSFVGSEIAKSDRPELTAAKIIVSGGRALGSAEKFNEVMTPLADKLGAAIGASRAAVDAGYAPNDWQVGQTGKIVAPQLYIAAASRAPSSTWPA
jgi:electron transfer flavoprotein alpha subunit